MVEKIARSPLGLALIYTGIGHFTFSRIEFQAQVPPWITIDTDLVVLFSGAVEITLGIALIFIYRYRIQIGWLTAVFFLAIFPGNISQYLTHSNAFDLDTVTARLRRLFFQPLLILSAVWAT